MQESSFKVALQHDKDAAETYFREQVIRYRTWLSEQSARSQLESERHIADVYAENAGQVVVVGEQNVQSFAPFRYKYSALKVLTEKQGVALVVAVLIWLFLLVRYGSPVLIATLGAITVAYLLHLLLDVVLALSVVRQSPEEQIDPNVLAALTHVAWPRYTILCPLYKEARVVSQFVKAMQALDYPIDKLQILFLTEEDDADTRTVIQALHLPAHFHIVTVPEGTPRTKPRACNFGLMQSTGQYVVIYDAEDVPDPQQLKKAVLTFANHGSNLACVQAKLNFYNPNQNLLTRWFTAEYSLWFDLILPGLQQARFLVPLGGTSNHFPTQTIRALGGWDAFNVTDDCDLGLRLAWFKLETVVLDSTTYEEANSRIKNWLRQRSRWIKGYMQTYLVHMREPWHYARELRLREFAAMQLMVDGKTAVLFINPLLWLLLLVSGVTPLPGKRLRTRISRATTCHKPHLSRRGQLLLWLYLPACLHTPKTVSTRQMDAAYSALLAIDECCRLYCPLPVDREAALLGEDGTWVTPARRAGGLRYSRTGWH